MLDGTRSHDDGVVRSFQWEQVRGPFSMRRGTTNYYLHADDLGSIVAITDTNAACVERVLYDDYGAATFHAGDGTTNGRTSSAVGNPHLFQGMTLELTSMLHFADDRDLIGLRDYNPTRNYSVGDSVIYNQSISIADSGHALNRRAPAANLPPLPGMSPGAMINQPVGNNPWSPARSKQSEAKSNTKAMFTAEKAFFTGGGGGGGSSDDMERNRYELREKFQNGDIPTGSDFANLIDSFQNFEDDGNLSGMRHMFGLTGTAVTGGPLYLCPKVPRTVLKDYFGDDIIPSALVPRTVLKSFFQAGDKPTGAQFGSLIDSTLGINGCNNVNWSFGNATISGRGRGHVTILK